MNLRSLGPSRTLVLLNGRRQTYLPARLAGGRFVDVNAFPTVAIERIDVLKEGAGAVYGSDAIAGVVNFITRSQFEGFEVSASYDHFRLPRRGCWGESGAGSSALPPTWWWPWNTSVPATSDPRRPGGRCAPTRGGDGDGRERATPALSSCPNRGPPECRPWWKPPLHRPGLRRGWAGYTDNGSRTCRFRYGPWDSLIYAQQHSRGFAEINGTFGDNKNYHLEMLYADARIPDWETTPSFPPVSIFDGLQVIGADHPGRRALVSQYPTLPSSAGEPLDLTGEEPWYFFGRLVGNSGPGRSSPPAVPHQAAGGVGGERNRRNRPLLRPGSHLLRRQGRVEPPWGMGPSQVPGLSGFRRPQLRGQRGGGLDGGFRNGSRSRPRGRRSRAGRLLLLQPLQQRHRILGPAGRPLQGQLRTLNFVPNWQTVPNCWDGSTRTSPSSTGPACSRPTPP